MDLVAAFESPVVDAREMRARVMRLEDALRQLPQLEEQVTHHFSPGVYVRELFIPKGAILTGKIHRHAHLNIVPRGDISVLTEHGIKRVTGPCTLMSSPGIKRAGYAHEDTIWMTVHANPDDERDLAKLEARFIAPSFDALEGITVEADKLCPGPL
jgi:hypothetical protein